MNFSKCVMQLIRCLNRIVYIEAANKLHFYLTYEKLAMLSASKTALLL